MTMKFTDTFHPYVRRGELKVSWRQNLKAGIGAFLAIVLLGFLLGQTGLPLLIAPFGASTILLFGHPSGALAQPINVFAGYFIAAITAYLTAWLFPGVLWATAASITITLMLMTSLRVTHPPAGAIPLIAFAEPVHVLELIEAVALGASALVLMALIYHRIPPRYRYPSPEPARSAADIARPGRGRASEDVITPDTIGKSEKTMHEEAGKGDAGKAED